MTPPAQYLSPELIRDNPALQVFIDYIREQNGGAPAPEQVQVLNGHAQDGFIDLQYAADRKIYTARLNAYDQLIQMRRGEFLPKKFVPTFGKPVEQPNANACHAVRALGGDAESKVACRQPEFLSPDRGVEKAIWYSTYHLTAGLALEWGWRQKNKQSLFSGALRSVRGVPLLTSGNIPSVWQRIREAGAVGIGIGAMAASRPVGDFLGLHPRDEHFEREAIGVGMGYGAYRLSRGFLSIFGKRFKYPAAGLGSSLITMGLANATLGRAWDEGSNGRFWTRDLAFFLPAMLRTYQGGREFALLKQPYWEGAAKWGGRLMVAGFLADTGYMAYNHLSHGHAGAVLENRLYARANRLHDQQGHALSLLAKGYFSFFAPALTERVFVPQSLVDQAREEMRGQDLRYVSSIEDGLRRQIASRLAEANDPDAWQQDSFWTWLREDRTEPEETAPSGRRLPIAAMIEQLGDEKIRAKLAEKGEGEVVRYLQREFRGYRLTQDEVRLCLDRIDQRGLSRQLANLEVSEDAHLRALRGYFDEHGQLKPGMESALMRQLFPQSLPTAAFPRA